MDNIIINTNETKDTKKCKTCQLEKPIAEFNKIRTGVYQSYCTTCAGIRRLAYYHAHKVKIVFGFMKLSEETRKNIIDDLESGLSIKKTNAKYGLGCTTINSWIRKGQVVYNKPVKSFKKTEV